MEGQVWRVENLPIKAYRLSGGATIEQRGEEWVIADGHGWVLNHRHEWEYEPLPSNRFEAFMARTRYDTAQDALDHWNAWRAS